MILFDDVVSIHNLAIIEFGGKNKIDIIATEQKKYTFIIQIAEGKLDFDSIVSWLEINTEQIY